MKTSAPLARRAYPSTIYRIVKPVIYNYTTALPGVRTPIPRDNSTSCMAAIAAALAGMTYMANLSVP
eukprot:scaffold90270_cov69-Phaeocystis_antarctica.AAC.1